MMIREFFKSLQGCRHPKIPVTVKRSYCPDCGKLVVVKWYIVRCACCNVKRAAVVDFCDNVKPENAFCPNCGAKEFHVEELENINFVDIRFAVHKKEEVEQDDLHRNSAQFWQDKSPCKNLLLGHAR